METAVLLVDDHPVYRKGLRLLLEEEQDVRVVGEAEDGQAAIRATRDLSPDLVIMDLTMPAFSGIEATRRIVSEFPRTKVVALSIHSGRRFVEDMLRAGAVGYILKESAPEELVSGIRAVMRGEVFLSATVTGIVVSQYVDVLSRVDALGELVNLTARENEVLRSTVDGQSTEETASALHISLKTVESVRCRIMKKFGVTNVAELCEYAHTTKRLCDVGTSSHPNGHARSGGTHSDRAIRTKLHRPPVTPDLVPRTLLVEQLNRYRQRPLTLISAPAGYGKSTLASSWLEGCDCPGAWVSLDEDDNDLRLFLGGVLTAIQAVFPDAVNETLTLLDTPVLPPVSTIAHSLLDELDQIDEGFILVLDDYHHIHEKALHELLTELLRHPPLAMHLVLITRRDPPLPLATLRARGQMNEIATEQLRFTAAETATFLRQLLAAPVVDSTAAILEEKTEGWVTGLRLAALSLRDRQEVDRVIGDLPGGFHHITEYLIAEVLSQQPPPIAKFLTETSILDRFCSPLCDALRLSKEERGQPAHEMSGQAFIEWLEEAHLFVTCLDGQQSWFRYHHLLQQFLQDQLKRRASPEEIAALHARASEWFAGEGLVEEALRHALDAGDIVRAAQIVEQGMQAAMDDDKWHVVETWLASLPEEIKHQRLGLLLAQAWILSQEFRLRDIPPILERIDAALDEVAPEPKVLAEACFLRGYLAFWHGDALRSLEHFNMALELQTEGPAGWVTAEAELFVGLALCVDGRKEMAIRTLTEKIHQGNLPEGTRRTRLVYGLAVIHLMSGDLGKASREAQRLTEGTKRTGNTFVETWSSYLLGAVAFRSFDLNAAWHHFHFSTAKRNGLHTRAAIDGLAGLAITREFMGHQGDADEAMRQALQLAESSDDPAMGEIVRSCQARLALLRGDLDAAVRWQRSFDETLHAPTMFFFLETPSITECRVLVAMGTDAGLLEAAEKLQQIWEATSALHYTCQMMEVVVLQAFAYHRQGKLNKALQVLEQAVAMATPGGWVRPFVELGQPMADLLRQLVKQKVAVDYIEKLLVAFGDAGHGVESGVTQHRSAAGQLHSTNGLIEPLTNREEEILELLAQRLRDKEIADRLFVTSETVKSHVKHIYEKLHVSNRREAVARASALGILLRR